MILKHKKYYNCKKMKNIILTGADGFIGNNILKTLKKDASLNTISIESEFYQISDWKEKLEDLIKTANHILHVGADSNTLNTDVEKVMFLNFYTSKIIFDLAKKYNVCVVYSSSAACVGVDGYPSNLYAWSKFSAEQYGLQNNEDFVALRYFNVYGPGEEKKQEMSSVAYQAWLKNEFELFPKEPERDFVYIDDVVSATLHPVYYEVDKGVYDVGTGKARKFEEVLNLLNIEYTYKSESSIPDGYQFFTQADKNKFMLNWSPQFTLEKGIKNYVNYLR